MINKNAIVTIVIVGALLLGGAGYYHYINLDNADNQPSSQSANSSPLFPSGTVTYPVTMTGIITNKNNPNNNGKIEIAFQDEDTYKMVFENKDRTEQVAYVNAAGATYTKNPNNDSWIKLPTNSDPASFFTTNLGIITPSDDLNRFEEGASYINKQNCAGGTCDTWEWVDPLDNDSVITIKVDSQNRVSEINASSSTSNFSSTYNYDESVVIEIPTDYTEFDVPQ